MSGNILIIHSDETLRNHLKSELARSGRKADACAAHEFPVFQKNSGRPSPDLLIISNHDTKKLPNGHHDLLSMVAGGLQALLLAPSTSPENEDLSALPPIQFLRTLRANFDPAEILKFIQTFEDLPEPEFCPVPIEEVDDFSPIRIDLFFRLPDEKFIRLFQPGANLASGPDFERLEEYKKKGLRSLWVKRDDFLSMVGLKALVASEPLANTSPIRRRQRGLKQQTSKILVNEIGKTLLPVDKIVNSKITLEAAISMLAQREKTLKFLEIQAQHSAELMTHVLMGSFFALVIARELGWTHPGTLFHLTIACLLRDIGMTELDPRYVSTNFRDTDAGTRVLYESHPGRSHEILVETGMFPETVLRPILQHHEACDGNGFPYQLRRNAILPVARLMCASDAIAAYALGLKGYGPTRKPVEAVAAAKASSEFDPTIISAAEAAFGAGRIP